MAKEVAIQAQIDAADKKESALELGVMSREQKEATLQEPATPPVPELPDRDVRVEEDPGGPKLSSLEKAISTSFQRHLNVILPSFYRRFSPILTSFNVIFGLL